jgi:hypothetical protein
MNEQIEKLALDVGLLNYVDHETPRRYFVHGHADLEEIEKFAKLIVRECATAFEAEVDTWKEMDPYQGSIKRQGTNAIKKHFGVEE